MVKILEKPVIKIGTKLSLKELGLQSEEYYCKVVDIDDNYLIIDYPIHKQTAKTKFFQIGDTFKVDFVGDDEVVYQFQTKLAERIKLHAPVLALYKPDPEDIERIQRRRFVRVSATVDVAVHPESGDKEAFTTVTADISGGGLSIILPGDNLLEINELINVWLVLGMNSGEFHYIQTAAEVVFLEMRDGIRTASIKFLELEPLDQQSIIGFCFEKQREMRKKELS